MSIRRRDNDEQCVFESARFTLDSGFTVSLIAFGEDGRVAEVEVGHLAGYLDEDLIPALRGALHDLRHHGWLIHDEDIEVVVHQLSVFVDDLWHLPARVAEIRRGKQNAATPDIAG